MKEFEKPPFAACPGSAQRQFKVESADNSTESRPSQLAQWPVQLMLVAPNAPYFQKAELVLTADCVPFVYADYHKDFLKGRPIAVACPKLDNLEFYIEKLAELFRVSDLKGVEVLVMEVPCCSGLVQATRLARQKADLNFPIKITTIGVRGENFGSKQI